METRGVYLVQLVLISLWFHRLVQGHGRLLEPPSRSSMWRFGYKTPHNYDDNQLFCGGVGPCNLLNELHQTPVLKDAEFFADALQQLQPQVQYSPGVNGKCGVCGDAWNGRRENEAGGKYATGTIVRKYRVGHVINVTVELTANHKGYFEFRLCPKDNPFKRSTWDCLNKHILVDASTGLRRYDVKLGKKKFRIKLKLPGDIKCKACMLQWKYNAGNSWGIGKNGKGCVGCGNQEQFYGCSDVAIGHDDVVIGKPADKKLWKLVKTDNNWKYGGNSNKTSENFENSGNNLQGGLVLISCNALCLVLFSILFPMYL